MLDDINALVLQIYEGATDPNAWTRILAGLAQYVEAEKALLFTPFDAPENGGFIFPFGISQQHIALWQSRYLPEDLWRTRLIERDMFREGTVAIGTELATTEELLASRWYREFLVEEDMFHLLCGIVFPPGRRDVPSVGCTFYRGSAAPPFDERHRTRLRQVLPHVSRSLGLMLKLRDAEFRVAASLEALNRLRQGVLLLDEHGGVCFANSAGQEILRQGDGLFLGEQVGAHRRLDTDDPTAKDALARAVRLGGEEPSADGGCPARTLVVRSESGATSYAVQVFHLPERNPYVVGAHAPRAIAFIRCPARGSRLEPELLRRLYGFTPAEGRAALALCDGDNLDAVATRLNISLNTLKTHLKSIYAKTAVDNRAALTKMMLSLAQD
jgi:DNA-binding CsgD family transcriptional regulator/PAS domain-containing protein